MNDGPYKGVVVDLVDPYFTPESKNIGGFKATSEGGRYAIWWMRQHPGRWAKVAEGPVGLTKSLLSVCPDIESTESTYETKTRVRLTYARVPHPEGESLIEALQRKQKVLVLPAVQRDPFNWTPAELAEAVQIARDNLFPVSS